MKTKKRLGKFACTLVIMAMTLGLAGEIPLFNGQEHVNAAERGHQAQMKTRQSREI